MVVFLLFLGKRVSKNVSAVPFLSGKYGLTNLRGGVI